MFVWNRIVPKHKLNQVANELDICIKLRSIKSDNDTARPEYVGDKEKQQYKIELTDQHYVAIGKTNITLFCLLHYDELKHLNKTHKVCKKQQLVIIKLATTNL